MVNQRQDSSCISMNKEYDYRYPISITFTIPGTSIDVIIRNIIYKILELQEVSFADMAAYGMVWPASYLRKHIHIFPQGQLCAEINGKIVASASSLVVTLKPPYSEQHTQISIRTSVLTHHLLSFGCINNKISNLMWV